VPAIVASPLVEAGSVFSRNLDHTSVLRFLAERFTPGRAYDDRVRDRHASGLLDSLGAVLTRDAARETPGPPRLGPFQQLAFPNGRPALTAGQKAFLGARAMAHEDHGDALADLHPESFFVPKAS
jgi:phospholipase C